MSALQTLQTQINGTVYFSDGDTALSFPQAAHVWYSSAAAPWAVIEVTSEVDVQRTIPVLTHLKRQHDFPFRIRSGGHHKAGFSTVAEGAVLSLKRMTKLAIQVEEDDTDETKVILMEPAVLVNQFLKEVLAPHGYGGVVGICGTVAEAGFILGGGIGIQSRLYGLGLDNVVGMRIVLADGSVRHVSNDSVGESDRGLFWSLRGAGGGSFGVVTQLEYRVHKASNRLLFYDVMIPSASDMATFLYRVGQKERELPDNLMLMHDEVDSARIVWSGRDDLEVDRGVGYLGKLLQELMPPNAPQSLNHTEVRWASMNDDYDFDLHETYAASCWYGFLFPENNTAEIWQDIMDHISPAVNDSDGLLLPDIELWGGAIHDTPWNGTAFPHRSAIFNVGVLLTVPAGLPNAASHFEQTVAKVNTWWPKVAKYLTGSYVNYPTTALLQKDYAREYWGDNLPRLVDIKTSLDPDNMFEFPMSVPLRANLKSQP